MISRSLSDILPTTSKATVGAVVPIPTLPAKVEVAVELLMKTPPVKVMPFEEEMPAVEIPPGFDAAATPAGERRVEMHYIGG